MRQTYDLLGSHEVTNLQWTSLTKDRHRERQQERHPNSYSVHLRNVCSWQQVWVSQSALFWRTVDRKTTSQRKITAVSQQQKVQSSECKKRACMHNYTQANITVMRQHTRAAKQSSSTVHTYSHNS